MVLEGVQLQPKVLWFLLTVPPSLDAAKVRPKASHAVCALARIEMCVPPANRPWLDSSSIVSPASSSETFKLVALESVRAGGRPTLPLVSSLMEVRSRGWLLWSEDAANEFDPLEKGVPELSGEGRGAELRFWSEGGVVDGSLRSRRYVGVLGRADWPEGLGIT